MKRIATFNQVVETADTPQGGWEVCATARARYDPARATLSVALQSCVRPRAPAGSAGEVLPAWLPPARVVRRQLAERAALAAARRIFARWRRTVRQALCLT